MGAAAILYVVFAAASNSSAEAGLKRFATASLSKLVVDSKPPPQPTTRFADGDGLEVGLEKYRGKTILVNLWATWCAPCVKEMPTLAALKRAYADKPFDVVAVSVDAQGDRTAAMAELKELTGGALSFYQDYTYGIAYAAKAVGFPTTILYGPDGGELARIAGEADWDSPEARALIDAALELSSGVDKPAAATGR
jgi:thiol-disulfide isomerase/thioredoxin